MSAHQRCADRYNLPNNNTTYELYLLVVCCLFDVRLVAPSICWRASDGHPAPKTQSPARVQRSFANSVEIDRYIPFNKVGSA
jgi:hypothetical protein